MRSKFLSFITVFLGVLFGSVVTYCLIVNPLSKENDELGNVGYQYSTGCTSNVKIDNSGISAAVGKVYDSVVMIENYKNKKIQGSGSGFIYKKDKNNGYIMTNQHVVEGSTSLNVRLTSGDVVQAKLLGGDEYLDIAIVTIPIKYVKNVISIGNTKSLKLGDFVFTIGSPVGEEYFNSVTSGIISGLNRHVTVSVKSSNDWLMDVLQVDAAINPGNSGGPLLNSNGEVIGVNSLKLVDSQIEGMGFAIKIEDALAHVSELEKGKDIEWPMLGINLTEISNTYLLAKEGIEIDEKIDYGIVVISVVPNTGASKSDLKKGDIIIGIDDAKVTNSAYLKYVLYKYKAGDKIKIKYIRNGKEKTTQVTLTKSDN